MKGATISRVSVGGGVVAAVAAPAIKSAVPIRAATADIRIVAATASQVAVVVKVGATADISMGAISSVVVPVSTHPGNMFRREIVNRGA